MREALRRLKGLQWDDRRRLIAAAGATAALLLVALLLPLAFRNPEIRGTAAETEREAALKAAARANLFTEYQSGNGNSLTVKKLRAPGKQTAAFCEAAMQSLVKRSINDQAVREVQSAGSEYLQISDGENELLLCRMWLQSTGDWHNWLDVFFDAESGAVYSYYVSRECLTNGRFYVLGERPTVSTLADGLALELDCRLRDLRLSGSTEGTAVLATGVGTMVYEIHCIYYDSLLDIRIQLV